MGAFGNNLGDREFYVSNNGNVFADGAFTPGGADFAELLPAASGLEPGDVLVIGRDGKLARSAQAYQPSVVGVYSTQPGFLGGGFDRQNPAGCGRRGAGQGDGGKWFDSARPGHAMKAGQNPPIGTALGSLADGTGVLQMLVILQ